MKYSRFVKGKLAGLMVVSVLFFSCQVNSTDTITFESMDTVMSLRITGKNSAAVNKKAKSRILELENLLSATKVDSDIYRINHNQNSEDIEVSKDTAFLVDYVLNISEQTDRALNPCLYPVICAWGFPSKQYRVPDQQELESLLYLTDTDNVQVKLKEKKVFTEKGTMLDLGAVGKGYAGDEAIKVFKENGISSALLDLGGNVQVLGTKPDGSLWTIGIRNPWSGDPCISLSVKDCAVITSGGYERYFSTDDGNNYIHIFDGKTGRPVNNKMAAASIVCKSGLYGDALSTATFVMGMEKAIDFWRQKQDFEMILITENGEVAYTEGLEENISFLHEFPVVNIIRQ